MNIIMSSKSKMHYKIESDVESDVESDNISDKSDIEIKPIKTQLKKQLIPKQNSENESSKQIKSKIIKPSKLEDNELENVKQIKSKIIKPSELEDDELEENVKQKETYEDLIIQYEKYKNKINKAYVLLSSQLLEIKKMDKNIDIIVNKMNKLHGKKSKTKKSNINCGFNKETPIPQVLIDFLELEDTVLPRPKVGSLLTKKLKDLGLKTGQYIQLDTDTINKLGLDESYLEPIKQTYFQKLLAIFYKK